MNAFVRLGHFLFRSLAIVTGAPGAALYFRPKIYHEDRHDKSTPIKRGTIIIANHVSVTDYFLFQLLFGYRKARTLVSEYFDTYSKSSRMSRWMDDIVVHRERNDLSFLGEAAGALRKGDVLIIFPEGRFVKRGEIAPFRPAAAYLSLLTGAPIVPVYSDEVYGKWRRTRVIIGKRILPDRQGKSGLPGREETAALTVRLETVMKGLREKLSFYRRYRTYNKFDFHWLGLDLLKIILWPITPFVFPTRFHYFGNASRKDRRIRGRAVVASRHMSFYDPPILQMHYFSRRLRTIIGDDLYRRDPRMFKSLGTIEYHRLAKGVDFGCFLTAVGILKAEGVVGIYPESGIQKEGLGDFAGGAAYFSLAADAPIHLYAMKRPFKPFRMNHVMIGETLRPSDFFSPEERKDKAAVSRYTAILRDRFSELVKALEDCGRRSRRTPQKPSAS